ncbi:hypothetical protein [Legionella feeleii]|uniref:Uncharacterized protein n=1 Tax=Legionella feeleii TaxID=453 RepID=A0A378IXI3_9GAMM|nr:hypothetical protein [Legionella feeleii]STX39295.1 Uncharacterised protein [Legionella feeleii]
MRLVLYGIVFLATWVLSACATHRPELKAPCDPLTCYNRINVNTWVKD